MPVSAFRSFRPLLAAALLAGALTVSAQDATPEATPADAGAVGPNSLVVSDQVSLFGVVTVESVTAEADGWVVIHADHNGMPAHVVGIAPVPAGTSQAVGVFIDGAMSTPTLYAVIHTDTDEIGVFEHTKNPAADPRAAGSEPTPFTIGAIVAFDQQPMNDMVTIASAIIPVDGWLVIHADEGGAPGPVIGSAQLRAGTNAPVMVSIDAAAVTPIVFPMLHVDDNEVGAYEFGTVEGADAPFAVNGVVAARALTMTAAPTVALANGAVIASDLVPMVMGANGGAEQEVMADANGAYTLLVDAVSIGAGFIDVHAHMDGHPAVSLGHAPVQDGENMGVAVLLMPPPSMPDMAIPPIVYPMLHSDTDADGQYRYLMIPGVDLPVVYNGMVVTVPVTIFGDGIMSMDEYMMADSHMGDMMDMTPEMTPEGMDGMGGMMEVTPEATPGA